MIVSDNLNVFLWDSLPETSSQQGSTGSSQGANIGFFGPDPTAGWDHSTSNSIQLKDFRTVDESGENIARHSYYLSEVQGHPYGKIEDLKSNDLFSIPPEQLYDLPDTAISNLRIPSQAKWRTPRTFNNTIDVIINVAMRVAYIAKTFGAPSDMKSFTVFRTVVIPVNFSHFPLKKI
jgi:hypothetical protein